MVSLPKRNFMNNNNDKDNTTMSLNADSNYKPLLDNESGVESTNNSATNNKNYKDIDDLDDELEEDESGVEKNKLNMYFGVFQPCMLNIFGAILFLRLPWAVGHAGWLGVLSMFILAGVTVTLTTLSIAAVSTNGRVRGGGAYYMISRSLGPEFGGAVGCVYYLAAVIGVTFYLTAFAENFSSFGIPGYDLMDDATQKSWKLVVESISLLLLFAQANVGAAFFLKFNTIIFAILIISIIVGTISFISGPSSNHVVPGFVGPNINTFTENTWFPAEKRIDQCTCNTVMQPMDKCGNIGTITCAWALCDPNVNNSMVMTGASASGVCGADTIESTKPLGYFDVFIVIFPAVTGIMAGANYSGDLEDPGGSIGIGTLYAIVCSLSVYLFLTFLIGASVERDVLINNLSIFQDCAWSEGIIIAGVIMSTVSSALGALVGSARVIQALARDNLIAIFKIFSYGSPKGDEPRVALVLSYALAQLGFFAGNLNTISAIISNFFLLVYFFINFACFVLRVTGAPNFRPEFKFFSWHTAIGGAALTAFIMFISSTTYAIIAIFVILLLAILVHYTAPVVPWGDVTQAVIYHQVRKYLLRLDVRKEHPKFWRPSIVLNLDQPHTSLNLIDVSNDLKKGGLFIIGNVILGEPTVKLSEALHDLRQEWYNYISKANVKAFFELCVAPSCRIGFRNLMLSAGLGGMKPNTLILQYFNRKNNNNSLGNNNDHRRVPSSPFHRQQSYHYEERAKDTLRNISTILDKCGGEGSHISDQVEFFYIVKDALVLRRNVLIARHFDDIDKEMIRAFNARARRTGMEKEYMTIDAWGYCDTRDNVNDTEWDNIRGNLSLSLQLAYGLKRQGVWKTHTKLRALVAVHVQGNNESVESSDKVADAHARLRKLLKIIRVNAEIVVFTISGGSQDSGGFESAFNLTLVEQSRTTALTFVPLPSIDMGLFPENSKSTGTQSGNTIDVRKYMKQVDLLTAGLPPVFLVASANQKTMSTEL